MRLQKQPRSWCPKASNKPVFKWPLNFYTQVIFRSEGLQGDAEATPSSNLGQQRHWREGKKPICNPFTFPSPWERNPAKQGGQCHHMGELMATACAKSSIHSQHFSRFKLCAILDNQEDKASLSNPIFPALSSLPSKRACITGSFGDLPPANHGHRIPRMLPADALALLSGAGEGPSAGPRTGRNPHLQLNYPPTTAMCWGHGSRKTRGNRISLSSPLFPSPSLLKRWRDTAQHSMKAHRKNLRHLEFPPGHSRCYVKCLFLHVVPENTRWRIKAATWRGFRKPLS